MAYIEALEKALGRKATKNFLPLQDGDVPATHADTAELSRATGFSPQTSVTDGVRRFVDWYRSYMGV
jgi:UDP-glucuronate 4-epimerase